MTASVLVLTYNGIRYLEAQLESIRTQTIPPIEVYVCDDGSTDGTRQFVRGYLEQHGLSAWRLIENEQNKGLGHNGEDALPFLRGDVIFTADQDDVWLPSKIEETLALMCDGVSCVSSHALVIDGSGARTDRFGDCGIVRNEPTDGSVDVLPFEAWLGYGYIAGCSMGMTRNVVELVVQAGRPELGSSIGIDWYYGVLSAILGKVIRYHKPLFLRRIHDSNASLERLRSDTVQTTTNAARVASLFQAANAHRFLLESTTIRAHMTERQRTETQRMASFLERRARFCESGNFFTFLLLGCQGRQYRIFGKGRLAGMKFWAKDFCYAYHINWKRKDRDAHA